MTVTLWAVPAVVGVVKPETVASAVPPGLTVKLVEVPVSPFTDAVIVVVWASYSVTCGVNTPLVKQPKKQFGTS